MTDRKLLELAAKAAGIQVDKNGPWVRGYDAWAHATREDWDPLTDDGDALRLAAKLNITVKIYGANVMCYDMNDKFLADYVDADDPYAATRFAIVRAAAEIGKGM